MKKLHISIIFAIAIGLVSSFPAVFAAESITVSTDRTSYQYGENYTISGKVSPVVPRQAISILVLSSNYPHPKSLSIIPSSDGTYLDVLPLAINDIPSANFTIIAQYAGASNQTSFRYTGLPCTQQSIPGTIVPPIERGPSPSPRILDNSGNAINGTVRVGQQIQIAYNLANGQSCDQPFAFLVQIQDSNGMTVSLSWISGMLLAGQSSNVEQSWTPQHSGTYTAQVFTWQSIDNPNALAPPASVAFDVVPNPDLAQPSQVVHRMPSNCNEGLIHMIRKEDNSSACVSPDTSQKLIERGWVMQKIDPKDTIMKLQVYGSYDPGSLHAHFLKGSLGSIKGQIPGANLTISVNDIVMGQAVTDPAGCFQFNGWNDKKLSAEINDTRQAMEKIGRLDGVNLTVTASYLGDKDHNAANSTAQSYLYLWALPLPPPNYYTTVLPSQINVTASHHSKFQVLVKPSTTYDDVQHMSLHLDRLPCGVTYDDNLASNNDTASTSHPAVFNFTLLAGSSTPSGQYFIDITQNPDMSGQDFGNWVGGFVLNVSKTK